MKNNFFTQNLSEIKNLEIDFNKKLSKKEKKLLLLLIEKNENSEVKIESSNHSDTIMVLKGLFRKSIIFSLYKDGKLLKGEFRILNNYYETDNDINILLNENIVEVVNNCTLSNKFNLISILNFQNKYTETIFKFLQNNFKEKNEIFITIENLKKLLEISKGYERFYDFNTKIIKICSDDINKNSNIDISYKLIKSGNFTNNKVIAIKFKLKRSQNKRNINEEVNNIFKIIKSEVKDFYAIKQVIEYYLLKYDYEYVNQNVQYSLNNYSENFDVFLTDALEKNLIINFKNLPLISVKKLIKSSLSLHNEVVSIFKSLNNVIAIDHTVKNVLFLKKIYSTRGGEFIELNIGEYLVKIDYQKNKGETLIEVYKQK
jgi:plasmid replication initiation protein